MKIRGSFPYLLLVPTLVLVFFITVYPLLSSAYLSLFDITGYSKGGFVGLKNYASLIYLADFRNSLSSTFQFVIFALVIEFLFGLGVALLLNNINFGSRTIRTLMIFPILATPVVVGLIARLFLSPELGVMNGFLESVGLPPQKWLIRSNTALFALASVDIWEYTPFIALILLAGLKGLRKDIHEAAEIDGASKVQIFTRITLPVMLPTILIANIFNLMRLFKAYDLIVILTKGGPGTSTNLISYFIEQVTIPHLRLSLGAAATWLLLAIVLLIGNIYIVYLRRSLKV